MQEEKIVLRAYLSEQWKQQGWTLHDDALKALLGAVQIEVGESDESKETRAIKITEDTDGKLAAESFKFFNLMKMSFHDLSGLLLKESSVYFMEDDKVKIIFSLLFLFHEFYPKLSYKFNETDAKILLAIYENGRQEFTLNDLQTAYHKRFDTALSQEQATRSLNYFKELRVLKYLGEGKYFLREKMTYERN